MDFHPSGKSGIRESNGLYILRAVLLILQPPLIVGPVLDKPAHKKVRLQEIAHFPIIAIT